MKKSKVWISVLLILLVFTWIGFDYLDYVNVEREVLSTDETALTTQTDDSVEATTEAETEAVTEVDTEATSVATTEATTKPVTQAGTKSAVPNPSKQITYIFRTQDLYDQHYNKHGQEFGDITKEEYIILANELFMSEDALRKTEADGDLLFYDVESNTFGVLSEDGYIRTCFKPDDGIEYWNRQ